MLIDDITDMHDGTFESEEARVARVQREDQAEEKMHDAKFLAQEPPRLLREEVLWTKNFKHGRVAEIHMSDLIVAEAKLLFLRGRNSSAPPSAKLLAAKSM